MRKCACGFEGSGEEFEEHLGRGVAYLLHTPDANNECRECGAHIADPHSPECPTEQE